MIPPLLFSVVACGVSVMFLGLNVSALLACLLIAACIVLPFVVFILPTFLFERIIVEDFTARFYFILLFFKIKKVFLIEDIRSIREQHRGSQSSGPRELVIESETDSVLLSLQKYDRLEILEMIHWLQQKNPAMRISLLDS